jgi:hypothetical protein
MEIIEDETSRRRSDAITSLVPMSTENIRISEMVHAFITNHSTLTDREERNLLKQDLMNYIFDKFTCSGN